MAEVDETNAIAGAVASTDVTSVVSGSENVESSDANSVLTEGSKLAVDIWSDSEFEVPMSSTASISSSLYEHVEENGRTYHKYKEGKYYLPNDEAEQNRLDLQHMMCKVSLHNRLYLAPLKESGIKNVLDFGTGTGIWAIEFAEKYPNAAVIGSDLSPIQPELQVYPQIPTTPFSGIIGGVVVPANLTFEVDDMDDEWLYTHPFNFIHGRLMTFCMRSPISIFRKAFDALAPGGYLEMQDTAAPLASIDSTLSGTVLLHFYDLIVQAAAKIGIDVTSASRYKEMFEEVGFVDVETRMLEWPIGPWGKSEYHKRVGALFHRDMDLGAEAIGMGLLTRVLGMSREEVMVLVEGAKRDMNNRDIHSYQPFYVTYGRKPL